MEMEMNIDKLLHVAGDSGFYQVTMFFLIGIIVILATDSFAINFLAGKMKHWCHVPGLRTSENAKQLYASVLLEDKSAELHSRCYRYPLDLRQFSFDETIPSNMTTVMMDRNLTKENWLTCDSWNYDRSVFVSTVVSEWNLVCEWSWLIDLISTVYMAGRLAACLTCGPISDRFGRKPTVLAFHAVKMVGSVLSLYSPSYAVYTFSRGLIAFGSTGSTLAVFVILSEVTGDKWRHIFGIGWTLLLTFGIIILPGLAYLVRDHYYLQTIYTWPQFILILYIFLLDESPRWLLSQGRTKDALKVLRKIASINKRPFPNFPEITNLQQKQREEIKNNKQRGSIIEMLSSPVLRMRSIILWLNWFTDALIYYALMLNVGYLPGDIFLNTFLLTVVEIPANLLAIYLLGRIGRRLTLAVSTFLSASSSFLMIPLMFFAGAGIEAGITTLAIAGKGFITLAYSAVYVVTAETYPTHIRNIGMGVSSSFGRLSGMGASFVGGYLSELWRPLPCVVFGVLGIVSGGLAFLLPETMNEKLPETILEAKNLGTSKQESPSIPADAEKTAGNGAIDLRLGDEKIKSDDFQLSPDLDEQLLDSKV